MEISYSSHFERSFKKLPRQTRELAVKRIEQFILNPFNLSLKTHKLSGTLTNSHSFSINYSLRSLLRLEGERAEFIDIGSHSIYR